MNKNMLKRGLYEQVLNQLLRREIESRKDSISAKVSPIDKEEASKILSRYLLEIVEKALETAREKGGSIQGQVDLVNGILRTLERETGLGSLDDIQIDKKAEQLLSVFEKKNALDVINSDDRNRPESSILFSSLFTGSSGEPKLYTELRRETATSDRIDMLVSFIKWSGLRLIIDELRSFTRNNGKLRIITTSYMGATDVKAIEELSKLGNTEIKISYDTKRTRLHAKTYIFHRDTGFSTAYVGSSNLSNAAMSSGLEWNVKVTAKDLPETMDKINATFDSYWNSPDFEPYSDSERSRLENALKLERKSPDSVAQQYLFDVVPYGYQQEVLDKLQAERIVHGRYNNLVVAATGTGKTVISAFDYKRFRDENPKGANRLLFVAHREEILEQSLSCFRGILKDYNFGNLFVGAHRPTSFDNLFVSIQTFNSRELFDKTAPDFYDYIVIDEFHHAAASSYQKLLSYYRPKILLGLTATPERMDGKDVTEYFGKHIACEIRLPEAVERKLLASFQYFGVTDSVDLDQLKWSRGGYDVADLDRLYTQQQETARRRAALVVDKVKEYVTTIEDVKGLGFCVSIEHARFMSDFFNGAGIRSIYLTGQSSDGERFSAKKNLTEGQIKFIFVVDLYNEGVDIPEINTILFLRPTQSLTLFLQQLGRGLRITKDKECLTVLDFIGRANGNYDFEEKFAALLTRASKGVVHEIKKDFTGVPSGCFIHLEEKAREFILENIRRRIGMRTSLVSKIATFEKDAAPLPLTLENFTEFYHIEIRDIYRVGNFSRLCVEAGVIEDFNSPLEPVLTKAFRRICSIDSRRWIKFLQEALPQAETLEMNTIGDLEKRMLQMFHFTVWQKSYQECGFADLKDALIQVKHSGPLYKELLNLLELILGRIDFVDEPVDLGFECPLDLHCNYTRDQILVAFDFLKPSTIREGVKYLQEKNADLFFITLNKSDKDYSPTTMYRDYSISDRLFHWQSQSTTSDTSPTGERYRNHVKMGSRILLFVREEKENLLGAAPYTFLGTAQYVEHEGINPMNIIWELAKPIPAKYLKQTNRLINA